MTPMTLEPYQRPISPSVDSFPTAPPGSLEYDMAMSARRKARTIYYTDTTCRHADTPQLFTNKHDIVDFSVNAAGKKNAASRGSFTETAETFLDYVYSLFWGSSRDNTSGNPEDSAGYPISGIPKLLTPKQHEIALKNAQAIIKALDQMNKELQQIQEVNKEQYHEMEAASLTQAMYTFFALLKKQSAIRKDEQLIGSQGINILHQSTRENHEKRKKLMEDLEKSFSISNIVGKVDMAVNLFTAATIFLEIVKYTGYITLDPVLVAAAELIEIALIGIKGATMILKTSLENQSTDQTIDIKRIENQNENATHQSKDHTHDIKTAGDQITHMVRIEAEELDKERRMQEFIKSMAPGAA